MLSLVHSIENKSQLQDIISVNWNYCLCSFGWVPSVYSDKHFLAYYILMYYSFKKKTISYCSFFFFFQTQMHPDSHPSIHSMPTPVEIQRPVALGRTLSTCTCQSVSLSSPTSQPRFHSTTGRMLFKRLQSGCVLCSDTADPAARLHTVHSESSPSAVPPELDSKSARSHHRPEAGDNTVSPQPDESMVDQQRSL